MQNLSLLRVDFFMNHTNCILFKEWVILLNILQYFIGQKEV